MNDLPPHNEESNDKSPEKNGIVYLLTNPAMPDLVKIGRTENNLENRIRDLSRSPGIPIPFQVIRASKVVDCVEVESLLHIAFGDHRINPKREFFRVNPERVIAAMKLAEVKNVTPGSDYVEDDKEQQILNREQARKESFRFSMVDIKPGAVLSFIEDESIECMVHDDRKVLFEERIISLSESAKILLNRNFGHSTSSARGPDYWIYENESLSERRVRMEGEE